MTTWNDIASGINAMHRGDAIRAQKKAYQAEQAEQVR